ncbi:hypothetical protein [Rhodococcus sp. NBC_00294]|uniref:hypothetical protein n=1 Tax=Rhodococcus sp. NBC_00294 TaxID=2976004 RepID=UPI002E2E259C|nr:hypothetical protein [Rhodococcus sp. NBC_00294]
MGTWPGFDFQEHSVKVTTVATPGQAHYLANQLTVLSEAAWDAAMWLDTYPAIDTAIHGLITQLRSTNPVVLQSLDYEGLRHGDTWTATSLARQLSEGWFISALDDLSTAQRLSVAAELAADADQRRDLEPGREEFDEDSRVNQAGLVTRVHAYGATGPVPEGAAGYMRTHYGDQLDFGDRWWAAKQLRRMEQLVAACEHHGGRAHVEVDACEARCVVVAEPGRISDGDIPFWIRPARYGPHSYTPGRSDPLGKLHVRRGSDWIAELDPDDDDGFACALGDWALAYTSRSKQDATRR